MVLSSLVHLYLCPIVPLLGKSLDAAFETRCVCTVDAGTKVFWPIYLINLNLDPSEWFLPENIILGMLLPKHPEDVQPYLRAIVDEFVRFGPDSDGTMATLSLISIQQWPALVASKPESIKC